MSDQVTTTGPAVAEAPVAQPATQAEAARPGKTYIWGLGRRKTAVARVRVCPGEGKFTVNGRPVEAYFSEVKDRNAVIAPLMALDAKNRIDVHVNATGGGYTGQAGAVVQGLARALCKMSADYEPVMREHGFLTRDARMVERKKPGKPGARRSFQFSKR